jgi:glutathione S-transferase
MLTFYYHPLSPVARQVWIALLERQIPFEPVLVDLRGEQHQPDYLALNPFHHVPVIVDDGFRVLESLAILDYLEKAYPQLPLTPGHPHELAKMRMVQLVTMHELTPKLPALLVASQSADPEEGVMAHLTSVLGFLTEQLDTNPYFGGETLSLADVTAGSILPVVRRFGVDLSDYPSLIEWHDRLTTRPAWQQTHPDEASFESWKRWMTPMVKRHQRNQGRKAAAA